MLMEQSRFSLNRRAMLLGALGAWLAPRWRPAAAQEIGFLGKNRLVFDPTGDAVDNDASGKGIIEYQGGEEPDSSWRATFRFKALRRNSNYVVVIKGRFGEVGSEEAEEYSEICAFRTNKSGKGNCFWYFRGLARLDETQLRARGVDGERAMQATRGDGPGDITTVPNRYSPGGEIESTARAAKPRGKKRRR